MSYPTQWSEPVPIRYTSRDSIIYALGVGASSLKYTYENDSEFRSLPTQAFALHFTSDCPHDVVPFPPPHMASSAMDSGLEPKGPVLDGEREVEILKPLPVEMTEDALSLKSRTIALVSKGSGTVVEAEQVVFNPKTDEVYLQMWSASFLVGSTIDKSKGNSRALKVTYPSRGCDFVYTQQTSVTQAQLYRLSGDYNALHIDRDVAKMFAFKAPILHGLCTLGFAARHVVEAMVQDQNPEYVTRVRCRFSKPVLPGQTLATEMWVEGNRVLFRVRVKENDTVVIDNAFVDIKEGMLVKNVEKSSKL